MIRVKIRTDMSGRDTHPRFCDLLVENGEAILEKKNGNYYQKIKWDYLKEQVEKAVRQLDQ